MTGKKVDFLKPPLIKQQIGKFIRMAVSNVGR